MKAGTEDKRKRMAAIALGSLAGALVLYQLYGFVGGGSSTPAPPSPPVITDTSAVKAAPIRGNGPAAKKIATTSAQLDPTLHPEAMLVTESLVYTGSGRNIFSGVDEAPPPPGKMEEAKFDARTKKPDSCLPNCPPPPPPPTCPPTCPPINLKFFGTATALNGTRRAFLLGGDDVFVASAGDVVQRRYRVVSIAANSVMVEDIPNSNKQSLPMATAPGKP